MHFDVMKVYHCMVLLRSKTMIMVRGVFFKSTLFKLLQLSVINMMLSHNEAHMKIIFGFLAAWLMSSRWRTRRKTKAILLSFQNPCLSVSGVAHPGALESADNTESCLSSSLVPCTPTYLATQIPSQLALLVLLSISHNLSQVTVHQSD